MVSRRRSWLLSATLLCSPDHAGASFEPYQMNGGLVAAVAGNDYCVIASDTRLIDGGYEIYTRRHLTSRLWSVSTSSSTTGKDDDICEPDGSLRMPQEQESTTTTRDTPNPAWIASAGCSADCEALKRVIRMDVRATEHWHSRLEVNHVATLLSQVLYPRRSFPYYAFCVVAGCLPDNGGGAAFVYDAIGSFEQVAVASAGTGRELLQPILDRLFSSTLSEAETKTVVQGGAVTMPRVVSTQVDCTAEEAVSHLIRAYRSVSERDIGVGDNLVICVVQRKTSEKESNCRVVSVPLKQH